MGVGIGGRAAGSDSRVFFLGGSCRRDGLRT